MSALIFRPSVVSGFASGNPGAAIPIQAGKGYVGGWPYYTDGFNYLLSTKAFKIDFNLDSFSGSPQWDFTDADGASLPASPGENPGGLSAVLAAANQADNDVWKRIAHHNSLGLFNVQYSSGSFGFEMLLSAALFQSSDDDKFYVQPTGRIQMFNTGWSIDTLGGTTPSGVTMKMGGGEGIPLPLLTGSQGGTVTFTPTDWWT